MVRFKRFTIPLAFLFAAPALFAAVHSQQVSFPSSGETVHGFLYTPSTPGPHPAIVVIHEWWGLVPWVKEQARALADQGYVTLAVDLYRGKTADNPETAHELMRGLPQDRGIRDLVSAVNYLKTLKSVNPHRLGAVGWCMGGTYAALLAVNDPSLRAVAINYGALPTDSADLRKIHAAILGNFGALDQGITPEDVHNFASAMKTIGKPVNVKIYPNAGHAFQNPENKSGYRPADSQDAHQRMRAFFHEHLEE